MRSRVAQLPDLGGTQFADSLVDQVGGLILVGGVEVRIHVTDKIGVAPALRYVVAQLFPVGQSVIGAGEVAARLPT